PVGRSSSHSDQFPISCSVGSTPELGLDQINSQIRSSTSSFSELRSVRSVPELRLGWINFGIRSPPSSSPELRSVWLVPEPPLGTSLTSPQADDLAQDLIFSTLIGHLEKVFPGGKNDMTNVDLAATSSRPRTTGPPTWPTRHGKPV
ncbi:hypothetical protein GW17_00032763, partial [Ensete ventricosum]